MNECYLFNGSEKDACWTGDDILWFSFNGNSLAIAFNSIIEVNNFCAFVKKAYLEREVEGFFKINELEVFIKPIDEGRRNFHIIGGRVSFIFNVDNKELYSIGNFIRESFSKHKFEKDIAREELLEYLGDAAKCSDEDIERIRKQWVK
jgi:hypothetical protein